MKTVSISDDVSHHMRYAVDDILLHNPEAIIIYLKTESKTIRKIQFNKLGLTLFIAEAKHRSEDCLSNWTYDKDSDELAYHKKYERVIAKLEKVQETDSSLSSSS